MDIRVDKSKIRQRDSGPGFYSIAGERHGKLDTRIVRDLYRKAISQALTEAAGKPMTWGVDDCALFFANITERATGQDPASAFRGKYNTAEQANILLGLGGLPSFARHIAKDFGWKAIKAKAGQPGDLGIARTPHGPACVVCNGPFWVGRCEYGFSALPPSSIILAWSVA